VFTDLPPVALSGDADPCGSRRDGCESAPHEEPILVGRHPVDRSAVEQAVAALFAAVGEDPNRPGLRDTPRRVANALAEMLARTDFETSTVANDGQCDQLVMVRDVRFHSLCEQHLLPFIGVAHVAYLPADSLVGISTLARVVDHYARRLQVQERMTIQIADWIDDHLRPRGVGVVLEAEHLCMSSRGVATGGNIVTSALRGSLRDDNGTRQEFLSLTGVNRRPAGPVR
jgi:GTP cyclohydrolase IA